MRFRVDANSFIGGRFVRAGEILDLPENTKAAHLTRLEDAPVKRTVAAHTKPIEPIPSVIPAPVRSKASPTPAPTSTKQYNAPKAKGDE